MRSRIVAERAARTFTLLAVVLACGFLATLTADAPTYAVQRVVDGDTVVLEQIGSVRLIGIDTPETVDPRVPVQPFGLEASARMRSMLDGHRVRLEYDQQRLDKYRRTLAYLYLPDGTFVNLEMVRQGYAHAYVQYPFRYMEQFRAAERQARDAGRGLWAEPVAARGVVGSTGAEDPVRVWVNTSSRVYHCPGTRYYGNTARGEYSTEAEARQKGHRPAYGKACGSISGVAPAPVSPKPETPQIAPRAPTAEPRTPTRDSAAIQVWVNTASGVYHCPGTRYYGSTAKGRYMAEPDARAAGHRPARGRACQ